MLQRDERAKSFGQWTMIGAYGLYIAAAWLGTEFAAPALGYELAVGLFAFGSVFALVGAMRLGERAEWWMAERRRKEQAR